MPIRKAEAAAKGPNVDRTDTRKTNPTEARTRIKIAGEEKAHLCVDLALASDNRLDALGEGFARRGYGRFEAVQDIGSRLLNRLARDLFLFGCCGAVQT